MNVSSDRPRKGFYGDSLYEWLIGPLSLYDGDRDTYWREHPPTDDAGFSQELFESAEEFAKFLLKGTEGPLDQDGIPGADAPQGSDRDEYLRQMGKRQKVDEGGLKRKLLGWLVSLPPAKRQPAFKGIINVITRHLHEAVEEDIVADREGERFEEYPALKLIWERFSIDLAWDAIDRINIGAERLIRLWDEVVKAKAPQATLEFLARVSRCYVWGFDPECVIVCRSAIDTAFREAVSDDICSTYGRPHRGEHGYTLAQRINAAHKQGMIDEAGQQAAYAVNERARKTVHDTPHATKDVLGTIRLALTVVRQLSDRHSSGGRSDTA